MAKLRKNSKEYKEALQLTGWNMYDLYYNFVPQPVENCNFPDRIKSIHLENGVYTVDIHSNLWYKKAI